MSMHSRITYSTLAIGIVGVLAIGPAGASGFQIRENSVKTLGRANSGTAVAQHDASVVSNNPAAMVNLDTTTVQTDVTVIDLTAKYDGGGTSAFRTPLNGGDGGDPGDPQAVPALAIVVPLSGAFDRVTLGASVNAPFGLVTEYDSDWIGRYSAITSDVQTIDLTFAAAIAITERFSIGLGAIYQRADVTLSNAIDFGSALAAARVPGFAAQSADGRAEVQGDDTGIGWLLGAQWRPTDALWIGYAHRSEIDHELTGEANFTVPGNVAAVFAATRNTAFNDQSIYAPLTTPSTDTLSLQYDFSQQFRLMVDVQRTDWHSLQSVEIFRSDTTLLSREAFNWDDTYVYALGGEYDLSDAFTLRAGVAYDETPTNDEARTPRLPDNDRQLYSLGLTWNASPNLSFDAAYTRIEIDNATVDTVSSSGSRLTGEFSAHADLLGVAAQYRF
ncbi:MAG: OmpP1/FadL family transporter [Luteimonas sp.]